MSNNLAVETLLARRQQLVDEMNKLTEKYKSQIAEMEAAVQAITGNKDWHVNSETLYDDEHPDYIKSSQEEI